MAEKGLSASLSPSLNGLSTSQAHPINLSSG